MPQRFPSFRLRSRLPAHSLTGIGEVVLLPLDALKIKRQVNPEAFRGRGVVRILMEEGTTLYRGWGWTVARNAPGSFAVRISLLSPFPFRFLPSIQSLPADPRRSDSSSARPR